MLRVLIVEDNGDTLAALESLASEWGHDVRGARNGAEALRIAETFHPRVVLLDLFMIDRHGYDVAMDLRRQAGERQVFFIAITGWGQIADQLKSAAAGISHHLMKPVNNEVLRELLKAYATAEQLCVSGPEAGGSPT